MGVFVLGTSVLVAVNMTRIKVWWYMRTACNPSLDAGEVLAAEEQLAQLGPRAALHIERYLETNDDGERRVAANALTKIGAARSLPVLAAVCVQEKDDIKRAWLLADIADLGEKTQSPIPSLLLPTIKDALLNSRDGYLLISAAKCVPLLDSDASTKRKVILRFLCHSPATPATKTRVVLMARAYTVGLDRDVAEECAKVVHDIKSPELLAVIEWFLRCAKAGDAQSMSSTGQEGGAGSAKTREAILRVLRDIVPTQEPADRSGGQKKAKDGDVEARRGPSERVGIGPVQTGGVQPSSQAQENGRGISFGEHRPVPG